MDNRNLKKIKDTLKTDYKAQTELMEQVQREKKDLQENVSNFLKARKFYKLDAKERESFMITSDCLSVVQALSRKNFTLVEIARVFAISQKELFDFKNQNPEFDTALAMGFSERDTEVEDAMHKMATGFFVEETKRVVKTRELPGLAPIPIIEETTTKRYIPGMPSAAEFLMTNRRSYEYHKDAADAIVPEANRFSVELVLFDSDKTAEEKKETETP